MTKTNYLHFKQNLEIYGKTYFSMYDLKKLYKGTEDSFKVLLSNWVKNKFIYKLGKGFYTFNLTGVDYLRLANEFDTSSYISFEYALYFYNLIPQVPSVITSVSKKRSHTINSTNWTFEYIHLKDDLFFGYEFKNKIYLATPEKALADLIYLVARGKRIVELDNLEKRKINNKEFREILKNFPLYVIEKAEGIGIL